RSSCREARARHCFSGRNAHPCDDGLWHRHCYVLAANRRKCIRTEALESSEFSCDRGAIAEKSRHDESGITKARDFSPKKFTTLNKSQFNSRSNQIIKRLSWFFVKLTLAQ